MYLLAGKTSENAAHAAEEAHAGGMPQLDFSTFPSQIFWLAIAFAILYFALSRVFIPRIGGILEERKDKIASDLDQAARMKVDADAALEAYEASLSDASAKAHGIAAENRGKINSEIEAELEAQNQKLAEIAAKADARISASQTKAMEHVGEIAKSATSEIIEKLTGRKPAAALLKQAFGKSS